MLINVSNYCVVRNKGVLGYFVKSDLHVAHFTYAGWVDIVKLFGNSFFRKLK